MALLLIPIHQKGEETLRMVLIRKQQFVDVPKWLMNISK